MNKPVPHLCWVAISFLIVMGSVAATNFIVDGKGAFGQTDDGAKQYASALLASPYGVVWPESERAVKLNLLKTVESECVLVGTSHVNTMHKDGFPGGGCSSFINATVGGGSMEDVVIVAAALMDRPGVSRLVIELPVWAFKWGLNQAWRQFNADYQKARSRVGLPPAHGVDANPATEFDYLISFKYFLSNLDVLRRNRGLPHPSTPTALTDERGSNLSDADQIMRRDGAIGHSREYLATHPLPLSQVGVGDFHIVRPFIHQQAVRDLGAIVSALKSRGISVTFLLTPYHPKVFECRSPDTCEALAEVEATAYDLARETETKIVGHYDPRLLRLDAHDFFDDMHLTEDGTRNIANWR